MGAVYLVQDRERGVTVALKTLRRVDASGIYRFKREFRALADVSHGSLVKLHELFCEADEWFFTMEYVEGKHFLDYVLPGTQHVDSPTPRPTLELPLSDAGELLVGNEAPVHGLELLFPTPLKDEARLRAVLAQVTEALLAVHAAGKLHRDLKSDNVLVTAEGRAVLLDFGIAVERTAQHPKTLEAGVVGTPAYMSPEQAEGSAVDEATDWYSLGVMLYEALTGSLPFDGSYLQVIQQKQHLDPLPPSQVVSGVPADLDELCVQLLSRDPHARPRGDAVLRALRHKRAASTPPPLPSLPAEPDVLFVGRGAQLLQLQEALRSTDSGRPVLAFVHGASGMGKTTLVDAFLSRVRNDDASVVLKGVCYERESVPFKAFDNLIDALSRYLRRLPPVRVAELLPRDVQALAQLFPVLRRVESIKEAKRRTATTRDPQELRRRAVVALKELLSRIADQKSLCLSIDDLQWGDVDSAHLIAELTCGPDSPAMLMICTYRSGEVSGSPCLQTLFNHTREDPRLDLREVAVGAFSPEESYALARELLGQDAWVKARALGAEAQGCPYLLAELGRYVMRQQLLGAGAPQTLSLDAALGERFAALSTDARTLLQLVSVAGRPVPEHALALGASFDIDLQTALSELRSSRLLRGVATRSARAVDVYHDRIRQAVLAGLDEVTLRRWHRRLATTLEATGSADLEALTVHLLGAHDYERAGLYALRAAAQAADALAFDKAARLYEIADEHYVGDAADQRALKARWGDALVNAGRGTRAAQVYFDAALGAQGDQAIVLQRKAGVQLLRSGYFERGIAVLQDTLESHGLVLAPSFREAYRAANTLREQLKQRGLVFARRAQHEVPKGALDRLDTGWSITLGILLTEVDRTLPLVVRFLLDALEVGEPGRVACGLCLFHVYVDIGMADARGEPTLGALELASTLAAQVDEARVRAWVAFGRAHELLRRGELPGAVRQLELAEEIFRNRCTGAAAEMRLCRQLLGSLLVSFTHLDAVGRCEEWAREAEEHDDLLGATRLRLLSTTSGSLLQDDPDRAERYCRESIRVWARSEFDLTALLQHSAASLVDVYRADAVACARDLEALAPFFVSALAGLPLWRGHCHLLRALLWLTIAEAAAEPEEALQSAEQELCAVQQLQLSCYQPQLNLLRATLEARRERREHALQLLDAILQAPALARVAPVVSAYARRRKGELLGGDAGLQLVEQADALIRSYGVKNPPLHGRLYSPGGFGVQ